VRAPAPPTPGQPLVADPEGAPGGPDEPSGPDAVEQLQRAVLTAIGATRVALDALEAVVSDRARLDNLAAGGRDLVGSVWATIFGRGEPDEPEEPAEPT
jgi:hypothetical protein